MLKFLFVSGIERQVWCSECLYNFVVYTAIVLCGCDSYNSSFWEHFFSLWLCVITVMQSHIAARYKIIIVGLVSLRVWPVLKRVGMEGLASVEHAKYVRDARGEESRKKGAFTLHVLHSFLWPLSSRSAPESLKRLELRLRQTATEMTTWPCLSFFCRSLFSV